MEKTAEGGKTARACDSCISKRARWFCAADDAFLCQACDASVHSANPLARRHERVRLQTASFRPSSAAAAASWHHGFTRKARTPRQGGKKPFPQVPEVNAKEETDEEQLLHLLHRVPESKENSSGNGYASYDMDMDPAEFAADVESLLGNSLDNECFDMEELGLASSRDDDGSTTKEEEYCLNLNSDDHQVVKIEKDEMEEVDADADAMREPFELNLLDFCSNTASCGEEEKAMVDIMGIAVVNDNGELEMEDNKIGKNKKKVSLSLDSEAVIIAWGSRGTPWTSGARPNLDFDIVDFYWPDCMGSWENEYDFRPYGEVGGGIGRQVATGVEGEREARVLRYREKRRTRLFAKKIRYEVRKLNAEKRPRMKGRFVKRSTCFAPPPLPPFNL